MTATIELTGEVVRPGDSGDEAAPADWPARIRFRGQPSPASGSA